MIDQRGMHGVRITGDKIKNRERILDMNLFFISHKELIYINVQNAISKNDEVNKLIIEDFLVPIAESIRFNYL